MEWDESVGICKKGSKAAGSRSSVVLGNIEKMELEEMVNFCRVEKIKSESMFALSRMGRME